MCRITQYTATILLYTFPQETLHCTNSPVSSYDGVISLCWCSSVSEARKVFVYVNGETDAAWDA